MKPETLERYSRPMLLADFGPDEQKKLCDLHVLAAGAGGLGSALLPLLAGAGVGRLTIADPDNVTLSNLHRQTIYKTHDIGKSKARVAAQVLQDLNPEISVFPRPIQINAGNVESLLTEIDLVCDGTDDPATRILLSRACMQRKIPLVSGAAQGFSGQWTLFPFQNPHAPCYECIFPELEQTSATGCDFAGIAGPVCGVVGSQMALLVLKHVMEKAAPQEAGGDFFYLWDGLNGTTGRLPLMRNPRCKAPHRG